MGSGSSEFKLQLAGIEYGSLKAELGTLNSER